MGQFFTAGYGGRRPDDFVRLLLEHGVTTVVDVRQCPQRASMGAYVKSKTSDKGIERLLAAVGIGYIWLPELGNPFRGQDEWDADYRLHLEQLGPAALAPLAGVPQPFCLLCAEKRIADCHRRIVAEFLERDGWRAVHL